MSVFSVHACDTDAVAGVGWNSRQVGNVVKALRKERRLSLRELSDRMPEDAPMAHATLSEIERGVRKVTVDDLTALAYALGVSPVTFLLPVERPGSQFHLDWDKPVGLVGTPQLPIRRMCDWIRGDAPPSTTEDAHEIEAYRRDNLPRWLWDADAPAPGEPGWQGYGYRGEGE